MTIQVDFELFEIISILQILPDNGKITFIK